MGTKDTTCPEPLPQQGNVKDYLSGTTCALRSNPLAVLLRVAMLVARVTFQNVTRNVPSGILTPLSKLSGLSALY
jgi:hypothetical protein